MSTSPLQSTGSAPNVESAIAAVGPVTPDVGLALGAFRDLVAARMAQLKLLFDFGGKIPPSEQPTSDEVFSLGIFELRKLIANATSLPVVGQIKKTLVLSAAISLIDLLVPLIPLGWFSLLGPVIRPAIRRVLYWLSDGAVEYFYREQKERIQVANELP